MKLPIDRIDIFHVAMPLKAPFTTAYGSDDTIETVLVRLQSGDLCGWGESSPLQFPTYSCEWAAGVFLVVKEVLAKLILGQTVSSGIELQQMLSGIKGNPFAKAALDTAWWDLYARSRNQPLFETIGGTRSRIVVGEDFGIMDTTERLIEYIADAVSAGFQRIKLKYNADCGVRMIAAVRKAFPDTAIHIDCNSSFTLDDLAMFQEIDKYGLAMIEQPLAHDDLIDHADLQRQIQTPVCLDESITSPDKARQAIQIQACRYMNIKPARVGGLTHAMRIHDLCLEHKIPCWIGGMLESGLGTSFLMALACLPNVTYPSDIFPGKKFYHEDLAIPEIVLSGPSEMTLPKSSGVGAEPDPDRLRQLTRQHCTFEA